MEWSRPRVNPMSGHRKATERYCNDCGRFHRTHRHPEGAQQCPMHDEILCAQFDCEKHKTVDFPNLRLIPRRASK